MQTILLGKGMGGREGGKGGGWVGGGRVRGGRVGGDGWYWIYIEDRLLIQVNV